ncbi:unnamed protein product [Cyprideis torosa]|uniref:Uncharacterized protein n=1 Tax=Cyprideis torosa TaxID=163714 RepID=A0A7R8W7H4_9CRUS|nr:unnamed protein product [Cyprideis torosa]CAG0887557.1 unnamed protein product [Cyprideis torosa]
MASAILRRLCPGAPSHFCRSFSVTARRRDVYTVQDADDFEERVLQVKEVPVIIDFYADWCAPCRLLVDRLEKVIVPKGDKVHLAKVNVDELTDIAMDYNVNPKYNNYEWLVAS